MFARGTVNPWGHAIDRWGQSFITDGAGGQDRTTPSPGRIPMPSARSAPYPASCPANPTAPAAFFPVGFPAEWRGSIIENDFRANRTVRYHVTDNGSGFAAKEVETSSVRKTYRPVDLKVAPMVRYIVDWYNAIIDHGEVDFHHPLRDKAHGRIWRLKPRTGRPHIHGAPVDTLLDHLKSPEDYTCTQAKRELATRPHAEVLSKLKTWVDGLSSSTPILNITDSRHSGHGTLDTPNETLPAQLNSPEP